MKEMRKMIALLVPLIVFTTECWTLIARTYHVAVEQPCASDSNDGLSPTCGGGSGPWRTIRKATGTVQPGDTVVVHRGTYREPEGDFGAAVNIRTSGEGNAPITFRAETGTVIDAQNYEIGVLIHNRSGVIRWVVLDGFRIQGGRQGIDISRSEHVTVRNNVISSAGTGIIAPHNSYLTIEANRVENSRVSHGIYVSCLQDEVCNNIVVRSNDAYNNAWSGIQLNAAGVIRNALVEKNAIFDNAAEGPAQLTLYSVQDSVVRNNIICGRGQTNGIALWRYGTGDYARNNKIVNNTIYLAPGTQGHVIKLTEGSTNNTFLNNVMVMGGGWYTVFLYDSGSLPGLRSDYNLFYRNDGGETTNVFRQYEPPTDAWQSLQDWQSQTGQDSHSRIAAPNQTFSDVVDFFLTSGSPAIGAGTSGDSSIPNTDIDDNVRSGRIDIGASQYIPN